MGTSSQRKGRKGELELAGILREYGCQIDAGRADSYGAEPDLTGLPGIHIEVKRVERLNVGEAFAQASRDAEKFRDGVPVLFHRRNRQPWLVTLTLRDFMGFWKGEPKE